MNFVHVVLLSVDVVKGISGGRFMLVVLKL